MKSQQKKGGQKSTILKNIGVKILQVWKWGSKFYILKNRGQNSTMLEKGPSLPVTQNIVSTPPPHPPTPGWCWCTCFWSHVEYKDPSHEQFRGPWSKFCEHTFCSIFDSIIRSRQTFADVSTAELTCVTSLIARFLGPTWGPSGAYRTQVGPMLPPWTLLSGMIRLLGSCVRIIFVKLSRQHDMCPLHASCFVNHHHFINRPIPWMDMTWVH